MQLTATFAPKKAEVSVPVAPPPQVTLLSTRQTNIDKEAAAVAQAEGLENRYTSRRNEPELVKEPTLPKKTGLIEPVAIDGLDVYYFASFALDDGSCITADIEADASWLIKV